MCKQICKIRVSKCKQIPLAYNSCVSKYFAYRFAYTFAYTANPVFSRLPEVCKQRKQKFPYKLNFLKIIDNRVVYIRKPI